MLDLNGAFDGTLPDCKYSAEIAFDYTPLRARSNQIFIPIDINPVHDELHLHLRSALGGTQVFEGEPPYHDGGVIAARSCLQSDLHSHPNKYIPLLNISRVQGELRALPKKHPLYFDTARIALQHT